jgi:hypothetical protein
MPAARFPYMVAGEIPLTEWALLERHVGGCDECRSELDRLRDQAAARLHARKRQSIRAAVTATVALVVLAGGGLYVHQYGVPAISIPRPDFFRPSTSATSAPAAAPTPPSAAKPLPAATPVPARAKAVGEAPSPGHQPPAPPPATKPAPAPLPPVSTSPPPPKPAPTPATAAAPAAPTPAAGASDEHMPTQASGGHAINAAPSAEAMPTQGQTPGRSRP